MRAHGRTGIVRLAAFVAALVLVLQSAFAVAAPPVQRDIFGNVICAEGSTGHSPSGQGHHGGQMPDCCMLSCGASFQGAAGPPAAVEWQPRPLTAEAVVYPPPRLAAPHERRTPANPRAPPAA
ncbi:MAG TPA: DUF2946 family protein [Rhizobiaceae bacterium]